MKVQQRIKNIQREIALKVGKKKAIIAVSGGVDSFVCVVLANKVISKQLYPVYIKTGFNLDKEEENLVKLFRKHKIKVKILNKEKVFFNKLKNLENPLERRYNFGVLSLMALKGYAEVIGAEVLINGVNKNDKIVSNIVNYYKKRAKEAKEVLGLELVEPVADLYKEEIRKIAKEIGLAELADKQHIPGPALSVRIAGKITKEKLELLKNVTELIDKKVGKKKELWQYFPFLLNEKLDRKYLVVLRFVTSTDGLKAEVCYSKDIEELAGEILKKFLKVGRVLFDVSPKPPATIEFM